MIGVIIKMRNYNTELKDNEGRRYFYGFDYDVMHPLMLKTFIPHFKEGNLLSNSSQSFVIKW